MRLIETIIIITLGIIFATCIIYAWDESEGEESKTQVTPVTCALQNTSNCVNPILFEIGGPTIIVPASVVNESNQTILVKMKVEQWREGYYKLENAPVGGWVVNGGY